ncbi:uncharacterized protein [Chanodichthys erythropterus]|uniref:uncharacterized protein n=1 Tax=Chanodichthys erythropterus TaxID=933992 RepID=UPI00351F4BAE
MGKVKDRLGGMDCSTCPQNGGDSPCELGKEKSAPGIGGPTEKGSSLQVSVNPLPTWEEPSEPQPVSPQPDTPQMGVLVPIHSPYNTPVNPVVKADEKTWPLTQDLRAINQLITPLAPILPDVPTVVKPTASINPVLLGILGPIFWNTPLDGGENIYIDGSCSKPSDGVYLCGYAVVSDTGEVIEAFALDYNSAQGAELVALI